MVDGLFFCSTLTDRSGGHTPFAQAGVETPVRRRLIRTQALLGRATPGGLGAGVGDENAESCGVVRPHRIPLVIRPLRRTQVVVVRRTELLWGVYKWVSRFEASCICTRWTLTGTDVHAPWHGVLEAVWLHCDEAQQVGCLRGLEGCPLVQDAGIQSTVTIRPGFSRTCPGFWWPNMRQGEMLNSASLSGILE